MLSTNKELLNAVTNLDSITQYMLYDLIKPDSTNSLPISDNSANSANSANSVNSANSANKSNYNKKYQMSINPNVPFTKVEINYTKKYSKYNEPFKITNHKNFQDKLFWIFYKIVNNFVDSDLETINSFKVMKDFKFSVVEKLRSQKNVLKNFKISKLFVEDDLTNNEKISFKTFHALCILYLINVIILRTNYTYCVLCTNNDEKAYNLQNYKVLQISDVKMNAHFNNFDVQLMNSSFTEEELQKCLTTYFAIENIEKPLKAFSSYKLDDLTTIAKKLDVSSYDDNGKKRKKQDLYESILQKVC
jgi:hypothetical protein